MQVTYMAIWRICCWSFTKSVKFWCPQFIALEYGSNRFLFNDRMGFLQRRRRTSSTGTLWTEGKSRWRFCWSCLRSCCCIRLTCTWTEETTRTTSSIWGGGLIYNQTLWNQINHQHLCLQATNSATNVLMCFKCDCKMEAFFHADMASLKKFWGNIRWVNHSSLKTRSHQAQ